MNSISSRDNLLQFASPSLNMLSILMYSMFLFAALVLLISPATVVANEDVVGLAMRGTQQFFRRNAKWINLPSGGGSLVSGRGNFRPGFHSLHRSRTQLAEPLFITFKRSPTHLDSMMVRLQKNSRHNDGTN
ncbi:hypothetical protein niasHT_021625 [Heterodera trifolii]|uniref:Uncharacterized protein n=1 Tax=Heterodera trifolii TaxID=157864 RepID=A0ABD2JT60_9BILA